MAYSMKLNDILALLALSSEEHIDITSLVLDSRQVSPGALFFAYPGAVVDGRDFIDAAEQAGASAIIYEADNFELPATVTVPAFAVTQLQHKVGLVADQFYAQPSLELQVFGVTGTNGKTSCCYLLTQALTKLGLQAAMMGTIGIGKLNQLQAASHTTADPISVHRQLAEFRDQGITQVCMEVSSHALDQGRVNGVQFFCTLFTNLSHDHLDYHGSMQAYADAKRRLFTEFTSELVVTNAADPLGAGLIDIANAAFIVSYGAGGDVFADDVALMASGINLVIEGNGVELELSTPLVGRINVPNIELLVATLLALSTPLDDIQSIVEQLQAAPGRMQLMTANDKPQIVIDYAHTPDALRKALESVQQHCHGDVWCVFGCGGDRDQAKRALMGTAANEGADHVVITNDNPRSESAEAIAADIQQGAGPAAQVILDRDQAIRTVIKQAKSQDWVLIAGKGHESTQQIGEQIIPFSDYEQVVQALAVSA